MHNSHWSGSTRMGDNQESVVDSKSRVNGVENLRVVDAGIMQYIYRMPTLIAPAARLVWHV